jgi:hypothetical protein
MVWGVMGSVSEYRRTFKRSGHLEVSRTAPLAAGVMEKSPPAWASPRDSFDFFFSFLM